MSIHEHNLEALSRRERQFMTLFFRHGEMSARQLAKVLTDAPSNATIRTILRILEEKGYLQHVKRGREFVYFPAPTRENIRPRSLRQVIKTFFGGSLTEAVATFISDPEADLPPEELEELARLVKEAQARNKPPKN
ncbi:MAG: BlaI/MecI/CopY family transcriptional regulator [Bacteroidota bacterium]